MTKRSRVTSTHMHLVKKIVRQLFYTNIETVMRIIKFIV